MNPTGNLDQDSSAQVIALIKKLNIEQQITLILVTHDLEELLNPLID